MIGAWGSFEVFAYELFITPNLGVLYQRFFDEHDHCFNGGPALELGSGSGQAAVEFARRFPDSELTCTDLSLLQVKKAITRVSQAGFRNISFKLEDALDLSFPDASFDAVFSLASIKHWPDQVKGLAEAWRVVRPGGHLVIVEIDSEAQDDKIDRFIQLWRAPAIMMPARYFRKFVLPTGLTESESLERCKAAGIPGAKIEKPDDWPFIYLTAFKPQN